MLARERLRRNQPTLAGLAEALLFAALIMGWLAPFAQAGLPVIKDNGNASSTVSWGFAAGDHLSLDGAHLVDGHAELNWSYENISWPSGAELAANGSLGANLTSDPTGLVLSADSSNHVVNGTFQGPTPWLYYNSADSNVTASWEPALGDGRINYSSPSTQRMWDNLDQSTAVMTTDWLPTSDGCAQTLKADTTGPYTPPGMMEVDLTVGSCTNLRIVNATGTQDWSGVDRLILWVDVPAALQLPTFNFTAVVGGVTHSTLAQPLLTGPQQVVVDLDQLGVSRSVLSAVTMRFNFQSITTPTSLYIDDLRLGEAKVVNQTALISQLVSKANLTSTHPGSAYLSLDWLIANDTGIADAIPFVNLSNGPSWIQLPLSGGVRAWNHFSADVSSDTSAAGIWNLSVGFSVVANNTEASNATFRVDNVTLFFPNRTLGTYTSNVTSLGADSEFLQVSWAALVPSGTTVTLQLSTGNTPSGTGSGWSGWSQWTAPGTYALSVASNPYYRVRAFLATTNASLSPALASVSLEARHRLATGSVGALFAAPSSFLRWDNVSVQWSGPGSTTVDLNLGNGSYWTQWPLDSNISSYSGGVIAWRVDLNTGSGIQTPSLLYVNMTYEYLGPFQAIVISPSGPLSVPLGTYVHLTATALDAGGHVNTSAYFTWSTTDPALKIYQNNSVEGTYYAATPGNWTVTALASDSTYHASIVIQVTGVPNGPSLLPSSDPVVMLAIIVSAAAAVGFAIYELAIRRMFAIDDVFLIAKDGRLIIHNTRRMRADRDEDILSGMLTAIMAFLRDQDPEENGEFKQFAVGGKTTLLERGEHVYLTAIYSGRVPGWARKDLHRFMLDLEYRFGEAFASWTGSPEDLHGLKDYMQRFVSHVRYHSGSGGPSVET